MVLSLGFHTRLFPRWAAQLDIAHAFSVTVWRVVTKLSVLGPSRRVVPTFHRSTPAALLPWCVGKDSVPIPFLNQPWLSHHDGRSHSESTVSLLFRPGVGMASNPLNHLCFLHAYNWGCIFKEEGRRGVGYQHRLQHGDSGDWLSLPRPTRAPG